MANASPVNSKLESYLQKLRSALRDLPSGEVEDIVREIRSHVLDRAEASGQPADAGISSALDALGTPESLASQYVTEHLFSRAEVSRSPWLIQRSIFRWATLSIAGFFVLLASLVGYFLGASLVIAAFAKFVNPHRAGLWMVRLGDHSAGVTLMVLGQANPPAGAPTFSAGGMCRSDLWQAWGFYSLPCVLAPGASGNFAARIAFCRIDHRS